MCSEQLKQYDTRISEIESTIAALNKEKSGLLSKKKEIQDAHWRCEQRQYHDNGVAKIIEVKKDDLLEKYKNSNGFDYETDLTNVNMFEQGICDTINFGDIIDPTGHRHYNYTFVSKDGSLINTNRSHYNVIDQEFGVTVPFDICKYLDDAVSKYKNHNLIWNEVIVSFELPYHDVTVQKYKVPENHLYEYVFDYDTDIWDLWVIDKNGNSEKAVLK